MRRLLFVICATATLAWAGYDPLGISGEWLISGYKAAISPLQGRNMCNFWPTCSQFTKQAIRSQGFLPGILMGAERLLRCHTFAWSCYDKYYFGISHDRLKDPVENHIAWQQPGAEPKNLTLVAIEPEQVPVSQNSSSAGLVSGLGFADHLYSTEDYQRAAMEYLRAGFADTNRAVQTYAGLMAGESFLRARDYARARTAFQETKTPAVIDICQYGIARTWFAQGRYNRTRTVLDSITGPDLAHERLVLTGWSLFKEHRFPEAARLFSNEPEDSKLLELATLDGHSLPRRNRATSTLLSAVIPGAGHLYSGRAGDGVYAFLTVAGSGLLTYWFAANPEKDRTRIKLSVFGTLTALFHAANIYGANIAARDYNRFQERKYLTQAEQILHSMKLEPDYRAVIESTAPPDTSEAEGNSGDN